MSALCLLPRQSAGQVVFNDNFEVTGCPVQPCPSGFIDQTANCLPTWFMSHGTPHVRTETPTAANGFCIDDLQVVELGPVSSPASTSISVDASPVCQGTVFEVAYKICQLEALHPTTFTVSVNPPSGFSLATGYNNPVSVTSATPQSLCYYNGGICVDVVFRFVASANMAPGTYTIPIQVQENNSCLSGWADEVEIKVVDCPIPEYVCECPTGSTVVNISPMPERNYLSLSNLLMQGALPEQGASNLCLRIQGQFFVNADYSLENCRLMMEPGSEILVNAGISLSISESQALGCSAMWRGIRMASGGALTITGSTLSDAQYAIYAVPNQPSVSPGVLLLLNNHFDNNFTGLYIPDSPTPKSISSLVIANQFTQSAPALLPPYPGQSSSSENLPDQNNKALSGLIINNLSSFHSINNVFSGLCSGIVARNTVFSSSNDNWELIRSADEYPNWEFGGTGVSFVSSLGIQVGTVQSGLFNRSDQGIMSNNCHLTARNNEMYQTDFGIFASMILPGAITIEDNLMVDALWGILTAHVNPLGSVDVNRNEIITATENAQAGIAAIFSKAPTRISDNKIDVTHSGSGIVLWASDKAKISNNQVSLNLPQNARVGIDIQNTTRSLFSFNSVLGSGATGANNIALRITSSSGNVYCCNTLSNTRIGTYVRGGSVATDNFKGTSFSNHEVSLQLKNRDALLGSQTHTQNCWGTNAGPAVYGANVNNPVPVDFAQLYPFTVDPNILSCFIPEERAPMEWFRSEEDIEFEEYVCASSECILNMFAPESDDVKRIALGDTAVAPAVMWELQRYIYERLQGETVQNASILAFLAHADTSSIGAFYAMSRSISELLAADSLEVVQLQANLEMVEEKLDSLLLIDELLPEADSLEFIALQNEKNGLLNTLYDLAVENQDIAVQLLDFISEEADKLHSQNDSIAVTEIYEINEKEVNEIYLSWLSAAFGALDSTEAAALAAIAEQCPFEGGNAVYRARAFLAFLTKGYASYNDSLLCAPIELLTVRPDNGTPVQISKNEAGLRIFPNPVQNEINIAWATSSTDTPGTLAVYDVFGRQVLRQSLDAGSNAHTLNIRDLPDGLYFFRIRFQGWDAIRKIIVTR